MFAKLVLNVSPLLSLFLPPSFFDILGSLLIRGDASRCSSTGCSPSVTVPSSDFGSGRLSLFQEPLDYLPLLFPADTLQMVTAVGIGMGSCVATAET